MSGTGTFTIDWVALCCHQAYARGDQNALRRNGAIEYDAERLAAVSEPMLFYGPYITLEPGVYLLTFKGRIDGNLSVDFAYDGGRSFKEINLDHFTGPVCLTITRRVANFEVRGRKTPLLKSMRLEAIEVDRVYAEPPR